MHSPSPFWLCLLGRICLGKVHDLGWVVRRYRLRWWLRLKEQPCQAAWTRERCRYGMLPSISFDHRRSATRLSGGATPPLSLICSHVHYKLPYLYYCYYSVMKILEVLYLWELHAWVNSPPQSFCHYYLHIISFISWWWCQSRKHTQWPLVAIIIAASSIASFLVDSIPVYASNSSPFPDEDKVSPSYETWVIKSGILTNRTDSEHRPMWFTRYANNPPLKDTLDWTSSCLNRLFSHLYCLLLGWAICSTIF